MNQYPRWKYWLVLIVLVTGVFYALPNIYGKDPSVLVTPITDATLDDTNRERLLSALEAEGLGPNSYDFDGDGRLRLRYSDLDGQGKALEAVKNQLTDRAFDNAFVASPMLAAATPDWLNSINGKPMVLGLDLQGGVHFLIEVDTQTARRKKLEEFESGIRNALREERIRFSNFRASETRFEITLENPSQLPAASQQIVQINPLFSQTPLDNDRVLRVDVPETVWQEFERNAIGQNLTVLRNRVNVIGVAEPIVQQQGANRIVVELPGIQDIEEARKVLEGVASLEYRGNCENNAFEAQRSGIIPAGCKLYQDRQGSPVLLSRRIIVSGEHLTNAVATLDQQTGQPVVNVTLNSVGGRRMARFTQDNVNKRMGVVYIDVRPGGRIVEEVISNANIQEPFGSRFRTTGLDPLEAQELSKLLGAGALAAPIEIVRQRVVGPSLGAQNVEQGFLSVAVGFVAVLFFMAIYYRLFGLVANLALMANLVLIVAALSLLGATLTLPGIAGIVLTVGMAVDANVLIFERIREELGNNNSPRASIQAGYEKAFSTIADANVTTLIAAIVLFTFGTGPIKGFAVTLSIGIATSMFTAIVGTRAVVNLIYGRKSRISALSI